MSGAERYDRNLADIFSVQDEIAEAVTTAITPAIATSSSNGQCAGRP
jgi:TolB-like protein